MRPKAAYPKQDLLSVRDLFKALGDSIPLESLGLHDLIYIASRARNAGRMGECGALLDYAEEKFGEEATQRALDERIKECELSGWACYSEINYLRAFSEVIGQYPGAGSPRDVPNAKAKVRAEFEHIERGSMCNG